MKYKIVCLDSWVKPPPVNFEYDLTVHETTNTQELCERLKEATIAIVSGTKVTREGIEAAPNLQLIACNGTGTDHVDKIAAKEHGITVCHVPAQNTDSVSEHAFALYYSIRRKVIDLHQLTMDGGIWCQGPLLGHLGSPPRTNSEETLVVIGYGALGKNIERLGKALGMQVLIAERKDASTVRDGRVSFSQAIKQGTVFILVAPLDPSTKGMISTPEFQAMDSTAMIVNVSRGGLIDEKALAQALKDGEIGGAASDVFENEPATKENCPLLDPAIPNLVLSPHIAWYSLKTIKGTIATVKANLEAFVGGKPINVVVPGSRGILQP